MSIISIISEAGDQGRYLLVKSDIFEPNETGIDFVSNHFPVQRYDTELSL